MSCIYCNESLPRGRQPGSITASPYCSDICEIAGLKLQLEKETKNMTDYKALLREVVKQATPICNAIMAADACGQSKIKLDDVVEDAVHLGNALEEADAALKDGS